MTNIIWMPSAKDTYANILQDLHIATALELDQKIEELVDKIKSFNHLCPTSKKFPAFRKCTINKQFSLAYSTDKKNVFIIAVFPNKTDAPF